MKRLSLLLTVLCAAGLPLTAAALDYGPSERMLAAETSAPSLPGAHSDDNPFSELVSPHRTHADDDDSGSGSTAGNGNNEAKPTPPTARRSNAPTPGPATAAPRKHGVLSWQSLLPGSIQ